ncbi:putative bifunctional diguanylate cyclase/phosphodiesterase [Sphingomonas morindae]|uniref:EAL domain-containing protein n=1 Tax=Sphingomonas morindae TaxID=1541170 RepID=A0ABY4X7B7_9SPHN|nr:EAL domain-containing protein [Sphingomonas morindae]USI72776.1 EAL domain-containing protein [Sphingomonas morindae]
MGRASGGPARVRRPGFLADWRRVDRWLPVLVALVIGLCAWGLAIGHDLERGLSGWRAGLRPRAASGALVFVDIDARSLAAFGHWPWPRDRYVETIARLNRAGVQTIAFDVDFSSPSQPAQDAALAQAIARSRAPVLLPTFRQASSEGSRREVENLPIPILRDKAQLAAVNIFADPDGVVRSYLYGVITAGVPRPSIGAMLADAPGRAGGGFPIDGWIDPATIPHVSILDLLAGRVPAAQLAGRSVLIGASAIELGDRYSVPGRGIIPGPVIQLLAAETLRQNSIPTDHGPALPLLVAVVAVALMVRGGPLRRAFAPGIAAVLILLLPLAGEAARLGTFRIAPALLALFGGGAALLFHGALRAAREARHFDAETGLANGRSLQELVAATPGAKVVALRLTNFADVANVLGRERAVEFVTRIAERLAQAGDSPVHRSDETMLAWLCLAGDAEEEIERIDAAAAMLRLPFDLAGRQVELQHGFGLAPAEDRDALTRAGKAADQAVARGVRWMRYTADMEKESAWRLGLATELDQAMAAGDIWVAYQPKLDIGAARITAAEALVRWRHPERGMIPPDAFIPALEESGRIADLTLFVLERALADREAWAAAGAPLAVAVNLSALLPSDPAFVLRLEAVLRRHRDAVPHLTLEVTESAAMTDPERAVEALHRLAALGVALSIDDYGTGQSTLSYLKRLPAREIKIDKSFVLTLEKSRSDQAMVRSTIELAHELGFKVVAEGVETEAVLRMLSGFGCDTAQGWHIGRPVPADELLARIAPKRAAAG